MQQQLRQPYQSLTTADNKYPLFVVVSLGVNILSLVLLVISTLAIIRLAHRPVPTLVQNSDGDIAQTTPAPDWHREPAVIKNFVGQTSTLLFSWSGIAQLPNEKGELVTQLDPGVLLDNEQRITTPAYEASFALSSEFRQSFQEKIAQLTPDTVWSGKTEVHIEFVRIGEPEALSKGHWKITQIANLIIRSPQNPSGRALPFNKTFFVRAIDTPPLPLPDDASPLQQTAYQMRLSQLEIYKIQDKKEK